MVIIFDSLDEWKDFLYSVQCPRSFLFPKRLRIIVDDELQKSIVSWLADRVQIFKLQQVQETTLNPDSLKVGG